MIFTVLGSNGFIGSRLAESLRGQGKIVYSPIRNEENWQKELLSNPLGHVFYCIGLTANFRQRPFDTVEAHVCLLKQLLEYGCMDSLTYLSSTRVYEGAAGTDESAILQATPNNPGHLYNISKLMGESLCLNSNRKVKVVRLSNVYGRGMESKNFLSAVLKEAAQTNRLKFLTSAESSKDFISVQEVVRLLPRIAIDGAHEIYNLASGINISNAEIADTLVQQGVEVDFSLASAKWSFPSIVTQRLRAEFGKVDNDLIADLPDLLNDFRFKG